MRNAVPNVEDADDDAVPGSLYSAPLSANNLRSAKVTISMCPLIQELARDGHEGREQANVWYVCY